MTYRTISIVLAVMAALFLAHRPNVSLAQIGAVGEVVEGAAGAATGAVRGAAGAANNTAQGVAGAVKGVAGKAVDATTGAARGAVDATTGAARSAVRSATDLAGDAIDAASDAAVRADVNIGADFRVDNNGLSVSSLSNNGVAARAGLQANDRIISVDGRTFRSQAELDAYLRQHRGDELRWVVDRNGQQHAFNMRLQGRARQAAGLGVGLRTTADGVVVTNIYAGSPAFRAGLRPGDRIVALNGHAYTSHAGVVGAIAKMNVGDNLSMDVIRNGQRHTIEARLAARGRVLANGFADAKRRPSVRRSVARPDIDTQSRIEYLERSFETLRRDLDGIRTDLEAAGTLKARGDASAPVDGRAGADAELRLDTDAGAKVDADVDASIDAGANVDGGNANAEVPALPQP